MDNVMKVLDIRPLGHDEFINNQTDVRLSVSATWSLDIL